MVKLNVTDREGTVREVQGGDGDNLMKLLRGQDFGIQGTCGGMSSCGSCHVYAGEALLAQLSPPDEDEESMLEALADAVEVRETSRLSCQINLSEAMDGSSLQIAPQL